MLSKKSGLKCIVYNFIKVFFASYLIFFITYGENNYSTKRAANANVE